MTLLPYPLWLSVFFFFSPIFISWRLVTLQYCSGFCHTLTWISHGFTFVPHPDPPCRLPHYPICLGLPSAPALSTCLMHPTWAGDLFHPCQSWTMLLWRRIEFHISLRSLPPFLVPVEIFLYKLLLCIFLLITGMVVF